MMDQSVHACSGGLDPAKPPAPRSTLIRYSHIAECCSCLYKVLDDEDAVVERICPQRNLEILEMTLLQRLQALNHLEESIVT